jgi:hypothetical protein
MQSRSIIIRFPSLFASFLKPLCEMRIYEIVLGPVGLSGGGVGVV